MNQTNTSELTNSNCPHCGEKLPKQFFMEHLKSNFIRLFLVIYAFSFSMIMLAIEFKRRTSEADAPPLTINPYYAALTFAGIVSLLGWYGQKRKIIEKLKAENE